MAKKFFTSDSLNTFVNEIKKYVSNAISTKANTSHTHTISNITDLTATATELNYMDGVTSGVQTQLNSKVPTSRTVNGKALSSNITLSASDVSAYSKLEIDSMIFITVDDIDTICGNTIEIASNSGVTF